MARILKRGESYHIAFRHGGICFSRSLHTGNLRKADGLRVKLEETLSEVMRGSMEVPVGADLVAFLLSGGKVDRKVIVERETTLAQYFERYQNELPTGTKDPATRYTEDIHIAHVLRILGDATPIRAITVEVLQGYVNKRAAEKGRHGRRLSHDTIRKEIGTFASIWNRWGIAHGLVKGPSPTRNLLYFKRQGKLPFQSFEDVRQQTERDNLSEAEQRALWGSVFLNLQEISELLKQVSGYSVPWVFPLFAIAAHTGARRSEILRCRVEDFKFSAGMVVLREKKRDKSQEFTFRHVPLSPFLDGVMQDWLKRYPGGNLVICDRPDVPASAQMTNHHFKDAIAGTKWKHLTGWHCLRHSFASNCALKGVDERVLDRWLGHQTVEMRHRYLHLFPNHQREEIARVFS